ncbi:MAG: energy-coupling factor ABC transporter ATP-binding protein [Treponema sp.]|jgi:energy-coupling factor transport system ATP-binding protein|nr:energy-coupling factor ABC transporter ATP-binding protein [Treponema sp.]
MLYFDNVGFSYDKGEGGISTVSGISFRLEKGEFAALIGENGAGKSTLARLCNGLLKPDSGRVTVAGMDTRHVKTSLIARKLGFLFQNPDRQICCNTVREEILFGLNAIMGDNEEGAAKIREERLNETLELFGLPGDGDPFSMSRGERQQIALASVLAIKPELLILDEPTTGLDYRECINIMGIISHLHREGTTILMISHDMELVADYAERGLVLSGGKLIGDLGVKELMKNRPLLEAASLLPAQIPALAMALGEGFENVYTVDEMTEAVHERLA